MADPPIPQPPSPSLTSPDTTKPSSSHNPEQHSIDFITAQISHHTHGSATLHRNPDAMKVLDLRSPGRYGKVIVDSDLRHKPIKEKIIMSWNPPHDIQVFVVGTNLFLFKFASAVVQR